MRRLAWLFRPVIRAANWLNGTDLPPGQSDRALGLSRSDYRQVQTPLID